MTALQNENKREERRCMQTPDPMDHVKSIGTIIGTVTGVLGLIALIKKAWRSFREKHPTFKYTVIKDLRQIKEGQKRFEYFNAAMLRERLESIYNVYVLEMGWCPRSAKQNIALLFDLYCENFGGDCDALTLHNKEVVMGLPESKSQKKEYSQ